MANEQTLVYNPSAILNMFGGVINNETTTKVIKVKGLYTEGKGINYRGYYYDNLRDETSEACMTLIVPGLIRSQLKPNQIIECEAYVTKKIQFNGGRIDLQLNVVDVLSKVASTYTDKQLKTFEILQQKATTGHKYVDGFIKSKIITGEPITLNILIGKAGIIDSDIKHQLQEAISFYKFNFIRINLTSEREIMESLNLNEGSCD